MSLGQILEAVLSHPASHVVLTGGEPMIAKGIHELANALNAEGKHITVETAGTVSPAGIACHLASISPKLANSTPVSGTIDDAWVARHEGTRLNLPVLREWIESASYQLKFVVRSSDDLQEIETLIATIGRAIPPYRVQLMPEGTEPLILRSRKDLLVEACKRKGWRFTTRLHVDLFGNTRGT
jgi:7-carboxy-7-deazaguanine synthase